MNKLKTSIIISLVASPGSGKSTLAAFTFAKLKMLGINCELVTEFAKDKVWEENRTALANQIYVFAKQYYRIARCSDKVDVIVTDSPILMSPIYNKDKELAGPLWKMAQIVNDRYNNLFYFLKRVKKYNPIGRLETEEQSDAKAIEIKSKLDELGVEYKILDGNLMSADVIVDDTLELLNKLKNENS